MAGDDTLAREFTQDTFVRAFDQLKDFRRDSSLATWLHAIASSVVLNGLKKSRRISDREEGRDELPDVAVAQREAEPDLKVKLARAIDALPTGYRAAFRVGQAVFAISQHKDGGVPMLIDIAKSSNDGEIKKQAIFWLGQSKDKRALDYFEAILTKR